MGGREFDHVVVGLGGIGSGAAYWMSRREKGTVLGLERFELGHERGASQDHSRIIRLSYHAPEYVRLAKSAYAAWAALESDCGEQLIVRTGGLDLYPPGTSAGLNDYTRSLDAEGVPYEVLDAAETMARWPQWRLAGDTVAMFQAESGIAPAIRCNEAHRRLARERGATLIEHAPVSAIHESGGEFEIEAAGRRYRCSRVLICADAWTNELLAHFGLAINLTVTQEQVAYYASGTPEAFAPDRFPIWIWMGEPSFYGVPAFGEPGPKIGQDVGGGREVTGDTRTFDLDAAYQARLDGFMREHLPEGLGPLLLAKSCLYAMPPDRDFVIDELPGHPGAFVAQGAAHAFKFASIIGRALSDLAIDGDTSEDLSLFAVDRPLLTTSGAPKRVAM